MELKVSINPRCFPVLLLSWQLLLFPHCNCDILITRIGCNRRLPTISNYPLILPTINPCNLRYEYIEVFAAQRLLTRAAFSSPEGNVSSKIGIYDLLICIPEAGGLITYMSGKSLVSMLLLLQIYSYI